MELQNLPNMGNLSI